MLITLNKVLKDMGRECTRDIYSQFLTTTTTLSLVSQLLNTFQENLCTENIRNNLIRMTQKKHAYLGKCTISITVY